MLYLFGRDGPRTFRRELGKVEMGLDRLFRFELSIPGAGFFMAVLTVMLFVVPNPLQAQEKLDLIGSYRDWDAFTLATEDGDTICYVISIPKEMTPKNVNHGSIYVTVTHKPRLKIQDEVNIVVGYRFRSGSTTTAIIGSTQHRFFTEECKLDERRVGGCAWMPTPREDGQVVASMKGGNAMVIRSTSARGTNTRYRFSLMGFTAAYNAMNKACE